MSHPRVVVTGRIHLQKPLEVPTGPGTDQPRREDRIPARRFAQYSARVRTPSADRRSARRTLRQMSSPAARTAHKKHPDKLPSGNPAPSPTIIRPLSRRGPPRRALRTTRRTPSPPSSISRVMHCILLRLTFPLTSANTYYVPTGCRCEHWGVEQYKRCPRGLGSCSLQSGLYHFGLASHERRFSRGRVREFSAMAVCQTFWTISIRAAAVPIRVVASTLG